jgi:uncharacterized protein (DUF2147 family)
MQFISKITLLLGFMLSVFLSHAVHAQDPALGGWHTVDDETGEIKSLVVLSLAEDGTMVGVIKKVLKKEAGSGLCEKCEGDMKDQPIEGMQFIWGVERTGEGEWEDGNLLDPESGTVYNGNITIADNPNELEVRGYVGISLFGRSQTWQRVAVQTDAQAEVK